MFQKLIMNIPAVRRAIEAEKMRLREECRPRPARFKVDGGMPEEQIATHLAGTAETPIVRAIMAHLDARIVAQSDVATDAPRDPMPGVPAYTAEMRLHDAGGAHHLADLKARLQELTAAKQAEQAA